MKKAYALTLLLFFIIISTTATAQTITIRGKVVDSTNVSDPLVGSFVKLNPAEVEGVKKPGRIVAADANGNFSITVPSSAKSNILEISYLGYATRSITIAAGSRSMNLGVIKLREEGVTINAAVVTAQANIAKISGDTTQYNAAAFKTNPDGTSEDLLKKMPGVTVESDGSLQSGGQKIGKVLVNGKEYFDDDPTLALKSLPVDAVESIQMYDDKTDDAKFSGFDDGTRVRTVNIVVKKSMMNSVRGKVYAGYGTDGRYTGGGGINILTDNHNWVITAQSNNVNNQGFSLSDVSSGGGGGGRFGMRGGGSNDLGSFTTASYGGLMQTNAAGVSYSGSFKEKLKLSASYFFNGVNADQSGSRTQNYLTMPRYYEQVTASDGFQYSHRFNAKSEWSISESDRITFSPRVNYSLNHGNSYNAAQTYTALGEGLTNSSINSYDTKLDSYNLSADLWWQHRFKKDGRTLSLGGYVYGQKSWGDRSQISKYGSLGDQDQWIPDSLRQIGNIDMSRYNLTGSVTYTEPISKRSRLNLNYTLNYDRTISDRMGLNYDKDLQDYTLLDTATTNYITRNYTTNTVALGYNYTIGQKFNLSASLRYQYATLNNEQQFPEAILTNYSFEAFLPQLMIKFTPNKVHSLNFNYYANSVMPSVTQLQEIFDVTDILQVSTGNPNLKQSYQHNVGVNYFYNNTEQNLTFRMSAYGSMASDYIANHRRFLTEDMVVSGTVIPKGAQFSSPVNLNGYINARAFADMTYAVKPLKSNINLGVRYSFTKSPSIENYVEYLSFSNNIGLQLQFISNISEKIDFTLAYYPSINLSNSGTGRFDKYFRHNLSARFDIYLWKGGYIQGEATWNNSFGTQASYDQHYALVNAAVAQKFYKNQFEIKISGYDLLAQNQSFRQSTNDTYIQTTTSSILQRYFMASLTWKFDTRTNKAASTDSTSDSRPGGRPYGQMMPR